MSVLSTPADTPRPVKRWPLIAGLILLAAAAGIIQWRLLNAIGDFQVRWTRQRMFLAGIFHLFLPLYLLLAAVLPPMAPFRRPLSRLSLFAVCAAFAAMAVAVHFKVHGGYDHISDEAGYQWQAAAFAKGEYFLPASPVTTHIWMDSFVDHHGKVTGLCTMGWPLVLAIGHFLGCPWLVNPLLGALCVWMTHRIARLLYGDSAATMAALVLSLSPFHLFLSASAMSHTCTMAFLLMSMHGVLRHGAQPRHRHALAAGAAFGLAFACRPATAVFCFIPVAFWWTHRVLTQWRMELRFAMTCLAAMALTISIYPIFNHLVSGSPLRPPQADHPMYEHLRFGFGEKSGPPELGYHLKDAVRLFGARLYLLSVELHGLPLVCLLPALFALVKLPIGGGGRLMAAGTACLWIGYFFWPWPSEYYGPRFWYESIGFLTIFTALFLARVSEAPPRLLRNAFPGWLPAAALATAGWFLLMCWHQGPGYLRADAEAIAAVRAAHLRNAVVFVFTEGDGLSPIAYEPFCSLSLQYDDVLFVRALGDSDAELRALFPGRSYFHLRRPVNGPVELSPWRPEPVNR